MDGYHSLEPRSQFDRARRIMTPEGRSNWRQRGRYSCTWDAKPTIVISLFWEDHPELVRAIKDCSVEAQTEPRPEGPSVRRSLVIRPWSSLHKLAQKLYTNIEKSPHTQWIVKQLLWPACECVMIIVDPPLHSQMWTGPGVEHYTSWVKNKRQIQMYQEFPNVSKTLGK